MHTKPPARIAIYARYSSDLQNPSSVDDQIALCRSLIAEHFQSADPDRILVFSDAAISGGATINRPGINRLLTAAKAKLFDLVAAEGLDRISRSLKDVAAIYETLDYHGIGMWTAHEGRITELHIGLKGTMNALFLRDMKAKVKRGHRARIAAGFAASSCAYGYKVVRGVVDERGRNVNGVREIDAAAAEVIRRVYRDYAEGVKIPAIVAALNAEGIPAPNGGLWKRNALMGGAKKQEGILRNEIYRGLLIFNRSHVVRDPVTNKKRFILNPESEWTRVDVPHLRIIDDDLWSAVRRLDQAKPQSGEPKARPKKAPHVPVVHNQHALTGWVKCGWCGGPKSLANDTRYLCSTHRYAKSCKNSRGTKEPVLMEAVLGALLDRVHGGPDFRPALERAFARENARKAELREREAEIGQRIGRLLDAVERGVKKENVTERILTLQDEAETVREQLAAEIPSDIPAEQTIRRIFAAAIQRIMMEREVEPTRRMFQYVLKEIVLTPIPDQARGETMVITLREEGWPEFWRVITDDEGFLTAPGGR